MDIFHALHAVLIVALVALRPLVWDGEIGSLHQLMYAGAVVVALLATVAESWCGLRRAWRWGPAGLAFAALVAWLAWPAWRSPLGIDALATWSSLALHLGLAVYLAQVVHGRERLLVAALAAGLAGELAVAAGLWRWGLSALAAQLASGGFDAIAPGNLADVADRIARGGVFGSFTQPNAFAAYLLAAVPVAVHAAGRRDAPHGPRAVALALAIAAAVLFLAANSKGGVLCLGMAGIALGVVAWRGWRRWTLLGGAAALAALVLAVPALRRGLEASAEVRVGYWQAAVRLVGEAPLTGHGVRGYAAHMSRAAPEWAEPTRYVHNELLEAAVSGGLPAALLALAAGVLLLRRPQPTTLAPPVDRVQRAAPWLLLFVLPYLHVFGLLDLTSWPGGPGLGATVAWTLLIAALMAATAAAVLRLPLPGPWPLRLALLAVVGHCLIDFDLHAGGVLGTLVAVAVLAGSCRARTLAVTRARLAMVTLCALAAAGLFLATLGPARRAQQLREVATAGQAAYLALRARHGDLDQLARGLAFAADLPPPDQERMTPARMQRLLADAHAAAWPQVITWPGVEPDTALRLASLLPRGRERLPASTELTARLPWNASAHAFMAEDLALLGRHAEAATALHAALARSPNHLPYQRMLAAVLDEQAKAAPADQAAALRAEAQRLREDAEARRPRVHVRNRD